MVRGERVTQHSAVVSDLCAKRDCCPQGVCDEWVGGLLTGLMPLFEPSRNIVCKGLMRHEAQASYTSLCNLVSCGWGVGGWVGGG